MSKSDLLVISLHNNNRHHKSISHHCTMGEAQPVVFSTLYNIEFQEIRFIVKDYLPIFHGVIAYKSILSCGTRFLARKAPMLGHMLPPSLFTFVPHTGTWFQTTGVYKCNAPRCASYKYTCVVTSCSNGSSFSIS